MGLLSSVADSLREGDQPPNFSRGRFKWGELFSARSLRYWRTLIRRDTLGRQLLTGVLLSVLSAVILLGLVNYLLVSRQILVHTQQEINSLTENTSLSLQSFFKQRVNDIESISETPLIPAYYKNQEFGLGQESDVYRRALEGYFTRFADRSRVYYEIYFVNSSGRRICSTRGTDEYYAPEGAMSVASMMFLQQGRSVDLEPFRMGKNGPHLKRYAKPVFGEDRAFIGGIVLDLDMKYVEEILSKVRVGRSGSAFLQDEEGRVVVGLRPRVDRPLTGSAQILGTRWALGIVARSEDFLEPVRRIRNLTIFSSFIVCGFVMGLVLWRVSTLLEPVQEMVMGTQRFAQGELSYRISEPRSFELRTLAASFNVMAQSLEARGRELEKQLRQLRHLREMEEGVLERGRSEEVVLTTCLQAVAKSFGFDRTALYWIEEDQRRIIGKAIFGGEAGGLTQERFRRRSVPLGEDDILNEVIVTREPVIIRDVQHDPRLNRAFVEESRTREFAMAPICGKDKVVGILTADNYVSSRPLDDADKEGLRVFANAVGLAMENVRLVEGLQESEAKYRTVLDNSPEAVMGLTRDMWIDTWNRGAEGIFGYTAAEAVGKPLTMLFSADQRDEYQRLMTAATKGGALRDFAVRGSTMGGKPLDLTVSWGGVLSDFWSNKEWTMVIRDVTEAKRLQQQLIRSEKLSAVGQLISGIAHELNNPLQAVVGYADLLTEELRSAAKGAAATDPASFLNDLRVITDNAMRCQKIIENLLLFVRQGEIEKKPIDLGRAAHAAVELLHYKLKKAANIEVTVHISPLLAKARGNFQQLQQVFVNLINNACDAMSGQTGPKTIKVSAVENNQVIRAEVSDSGPGVPEAVRDRLFEPFFTTKGEGRGTGLGLAVCKQIVEEHGGRMGFRTQVGYGTTFFIELPVSSVDEKAEAAVLPPLPPVKDKTILVVDDEPDVLSMLSKMVLSEGDKVEVADSLNQAAEIISKKSVDLVVADVRLGEGTGINLFENWSLWSRQARPAFLFITGDVVNSPLSAEIEKKALQLLHKPIDLATFQTAVRGLLTSLPQK